MFSPLLIIGMTPISTGTMLQWATSYLPPWVETRRGSAGSSRQTFKILIDTAKFQSVCHQQYTSMPVSITWWLSNILIVGNVMGGWQHFAVTLILLFLRNGKVRRVSRAYCHLLFSLVNFKFLSPSNFPSPLSLLGQGYIWFLQISK